MKMADILEIFEKPLEKLIKHFLRIRSKTDER